jgi:hypothetical protein
VLSFLNSSTKSPTSISSFFVLFLCGAKAFKTRRRGSLSASEYEDSFELKFYLRFEILSIGVSLLVEDHINVFRIAFIFCTTVGISSLYPLKHNKKLSLWNPISMHTKLKCTLPFIPLRLMLFQPYCPLSFLIVCPTIKVLKWKRSLVYISDVIELELANSLNV